MATAIPGATQVEATTAEAEGVRLVVRPSFSGSGIGNMEDGSGGTRLQEPHTDMAGAICGSLAISHAMTMSHTKDTLVGQGPEDEEAHWPPGMG